MGTPKVGGTPCAGDLPGRRVPRVVRKLLGTEAAGGIVLLVAAVVALAWANSPWHDAYDTVWGTELSVGVGRFALVEDLRHWVNDGLMVVGISAASWVAVRTGLGRLPEGASWPMVIGIAATSGIGFTVSLFITELAFVPGPLQESAKIGVLGASTLAAVVGIVVLLRACSRSEPSPVAAGSPSGIDGGPVRP